MQNGKILSKWKAVPTRRFIVLFLSVVQGALAPDMLMPNVVLSNNFIELTTNKYAMFSSGFFDRNENDVAGMKQPIPRRFYFRKFNYVIQMYYFEG